MSDPTAAARAARYRRRKHVTELAQFSGWAPLDALVFTKDGKHRLVTLDGHKIPLIPEDSPTVVAPVPVVASETSRPKVYPPKSITPERYAAWKKSVREANPTREGLLKDLADVVVAVRESDPDRAKRTRQMIKMIQASPDGPDWIDLLP